MGVFNGAYDMYIGASKAFRRGGWAAVGVFLSFTTVEMFEAASWDFWGADNKVQVIAGLTVIFATLGKFGYNLIREGLMTE